MFFIFVLRLLNILDMRKCSSSISFGVFQKRRTLRTEFLFLLFLLTAAMTDVIRYSLHKMHSYTFFLLISKQPYEVSRKLCHLSLQRKKLRLTFDTSFLRWSDCLVSEDKHTIFPLCISEQRPPRDSLTAFCPLSLSSCFIWSIFATVNYGPSSSDGRVVGASTHIMTRNTSSEWDLNLDGSLTFQSCLFPSL